MRVTLRHPKESKIVEIKTHRLGKALMEKRGLRGLRRVGAEAGIHYATLQRLEQGDTPSMETFERAMRWLEVERAKWAEYMDFKCR